MCQLLDASYSWWTQPIAHLAESGATIFGSVSSTGVVASHADCEMTEFETGRPDDHAAPSVITNETKPTIVFSAGHNDRSSVRYQKGGVSAEVPFPGLVTYSQALTFGDRIVLLTRVEQCTWYLARSDDWAKTWSKPIRFVDDCAAGGQVYLTTKPHRTVENLYRVAMYGHPGTSPWRAVDYGLIDLKTGAVTTPGNRIVANIRTGQGLPLGRARLSTTYVPGAAVETRLLDVGQVAGQPLVTLAEWTDPEHARYVTARFAAGGWVVDRTSLPEAGQPFWDPATYLGGAAITDAGDLVVAREVAGSWKVEQYRLTGSRWVRLTTVARGPSPLVRPYPVRGGHTVLVQSVTKYTDYAHFKIGVLEYELVGPVVRFGTGAGDRAAMAH